MLGSILVSLLLIVFALCSFSSSKEFYKWNNAEYLKGTNQTNFFLFITFGIDLNIQNYWQSIVLFTLTSDYLLLLRQVLHVVLVLFNL